MNVEKNIRAWGNSIANSSDASFDYCFNYFQSFRESDQISMLASSANLELSCLQLGFFLASWGMYRGSANLSQRSVKYLSPIIQTIANANRKIWEIDAHVYTEENVVIVLNFRQQLMDCCPDVSMTDTLATKIMLGVFGCVPAFDTEFRRGCRKLRMPQTLNRKALQAIGEFYREHSLLLDAYRLFTKEFIDSSQTHRKYPRAKLIDMAILMHANA